METSVPLLAVKYLSWRSTLYTAACQCYFDCKTYVSFLVSGSRVPVVGQYVYGDEFSSVSCQVSLLEIYPLHSSMSVLL